MASQGRAPDLSLLNRGTACLEEVVATCKKGADVVDAVNRLPAEDVRAIVAMLAYVRLCKGRLF